MNSLGFLEIAPFLIFQLVNKLDFPAIWTLCSSGDPHFLPSGNPLFFLGQLALILIGPTSHQIFFKLRLVFFEILSSLLFLLAPLAEHEHVVVLALDAIDSLGFVFDLRLVVLNLLHHGRANLVQLVDLGLVLLVLLFPGLILTHRGAQVHPLLHLAMLALLNHF